MNDSIKKLTVQYDGKTVGYLAEVDSAKFAFQYDDEWLKNGFSISPLSLPLSERIYTCDKNNFGGVYGVFNDSLPDGWGEMLVKRMLAKGGINYDRLSPLVKLTLISGNGLGALTYIPNQAEQISQQEYDLDILCSQAKAVLEDIDGVKIDLDKVYQAGGSSGGARPKAHIKLDDGYWIVKFPGKIDSNNIGKEEFTANKLAKQCGVNVNEFKLFPSKICDGYFGAKRFDRVGEKRLHMISLSALLETTHRIPNLDYIYLFQVIQNICIDKNDLYEAFKRMCFNVIYGNRDDHGKNFSFLYDDRRGGYKLSPAYDLTKTLYKPEHEMTVNGKGKPTEKDILEVANIMKLSMHKCRQILERVGKILL